MRFNKKIIEKLTFFDLLRARIFGHPPMPEFEEVPSYAIVSTRITSYAVVQYRMETYKSINYFGLREREKSSEVNTWARQNFKKLVRRAFLSIFGPKVHYGYFKN